MTIRALYRDLVNAFDYLEKQRLLLFVPPARIEHTRLTWHTAHDFNISSPHANVDQYIEWAEQTQYSAVLPDASLLQVTYDLAGGVVSGHRLAYVPCPVLADEALLAEEPFVDVVRMYLSEGLRSVVLRSPIRFDFDPEAEGPGHPSAHLTLNSADCRIGCVAPLHPYQFLGFVYRHFYPELYEAGRVWFEGDARRRFDQRVLSDDDRQEMHLTWPL